MSAYYDRERCLCPAGNVAPAIRGLQEQDPERARLDTIFTREDPGRRAGYPSASTQSVRGAPAPLESKGVR